MIDRVGFEPTDVYLEYLLLPRIGPSALWTVQLAAEDTIAVHRKASWITEAAVRRLFPPSFSGSHHVPLAKHQARYARRLDRGITAGPRWGSEAHSPYG